jgi:hypothetical protein
MKPQLTDLSGNILISIGQMAKASGVCASSLRGYETLGLMAKYGIEVSRHGKSRYYKSEDSWRIAQIKAERATRRNRLLGSQSSRNANEY